MKRKKRVKINKYSKHKIIQIVIINKKIREEQLQQIKIKMKKLPLIWQI